MINRSQRRHRSDQRLIDGLAGPSDDIQALLFEDPGAGLLVVDSTGMIARMNTALREMVPDAPTVAPGQMAVNLIAEADRKRFEHLLLAGLRGNTFARLERLRLLGHDRTDGLQVVLSMTPLREADDTVSGVLLRLTDITAEAQLEAELSEGRKMQAVGQMAGGIAHDFNNLLATILTAADAVLGRVEADGETAEDIRHIRLAAERGAALVRQLLAFSRRQPLRPQVVSINAAIRQLSVLLLRLLGESIQLDLLLEEPGRRVHTDPSQLDQVLINLVVNARDAMPKGGRVTVRTGHRAIYRPETLGAEIVPPGRYVTIEVEDTGVGIPPETLPRIFEPFFTTRQHSGGTGLGLSTVIGIVRQSGGFITVDSVPGRGTTVRVALPRCDETPREDPLPQEVQPTVVAEPELGRRGTVLLVDDEESLCKLTARALRRAGWTVMTAGCADEALATIAAGDATRIDMLVSDVVMPGLDGFGLVVALREIWPDLSAILVSGYSGSSLRSDAAVKGVAFLPKPYQMKELIAVMESLPAVLI